MAQKIEGACEEGEGEEKGWLNWWPYFHTSQEYILSCWRVSWNAVNSKLNTNNAHQSKAIPFKKLYASRALYSIYSVTFDSAALYGGVHITIFLVSAIRVSAFATNRLVVILLRPMVRDQVEQSINIFELFCTHWVDVQNSAITKVAVCYMAILITAAYHEILFLYV